METGTATKRHMVMISPEAIARLKRLGGTLRNGLDLASYATDVAAMYESRDRAAGIVAAAPLTEKQAETRERQERADENRRAAEERRHEERRAREQKAKDKADAAAYSKDPVGWQLAHFEAHGYLGLTRESITHELVDQFEAEIKDGCSPKHMAAMTPEELEQAAVGQALADAWDAGED